MKVELCFLFLTWPRYRSVTSLCGWGPLSLSYHSAKFGVHRPYGTGNNGVSSISSNFNSISSSNSSAEVPMPRFTNGCFNVVDCLYLSCCCWHKSQTFSEKSHLWAHNHILFIAYWRHQKIGEFLFCLKLISSAYLKNASDFQSFCVKKLFRNL